MKESSFFEYLRQCNVNIETAEKYVFSLSNQKLHKFACLCDLYIHGTDNEVKDAISPFSFVATNGLSGDSSTCAEISCRLRRANELGKFAALYADRVLIKNPFEYWSVVEEYSDNQRTELANDILVLLSNEVLFEASIFHFSKAENHFCYDCFKKMISSKGETKGKEEQAIHFYRDEIFKKATFSVSIQDNEVDIKITGDEDFIEHGENHLISYNPINSYLSPYVGKNKIPKTALLKSGLLEYVLSPLLEDFIMQEWYSKNYRFNLLTDRKVHVDLVKTFNSCKNEIGSLIPYPMNVDIKKLIDLRKNDGLAFVNFQNEFSSVLNDTTVRTQKELTEMIQDKVIPEVRKIDLLMKRNKKNIVKNLSTEVAICSGLICAGLYSGILPNNIAELVSAIGGFDITKSLIVNGLEAITTPETIKEQPYYFLWKSMK